MVESALKFSLRVLWKIVLLAVHDFQNGDRFRTLQNVSIYFLLFYHNNVMLKTDIMLDSTYTQQLLTKAGVRFGML